MKVHIVNCDSNLVALNHMAPMMAEYCQPRQALCDDIVPVRDYTMITALPV
jgi:hypothetical protein